MKPLVAINHSSPPVLLIPDRRQAAGAETGGSAKPACAIIATNNINSMIRTQPLPAVVQYTHNAGHEVVHDIIT
jgi:hypothetical protein